MPEPRMPEPRIDDDPADELRQQQNEPGEARRDNIGLADRVMDLVTRPNNDFELFTDPDRNTAYALIDNGCGRRVCEVGDKQFKRAVLRAYFIEHHRTVSRASVDTAVEMIRAIATAGEIRRPYCRIANLGDRIYLDLGTANGETVEIGPRGWKVVPRAPVLFRRGPGLRELPMPELGGSLKELDPLLGSLSEDDRSLLVAFLLSAFMDEGQRPLLQIIGGSNSGKSTIAQMAVSMIDPNEEPLVSPPSSERTLRLRSKGRAIIVFNNASSLGRGMSDAFCRLLDGDGHIERMLYEDTEVVVFSDRCSPIITGIYPVVQKGDLQSRTLTIRCSPIADKHRLSKAVLKSKLTAIAPRMLGALLDAVACSLANRDSLPSMTWPRLIDFAQLVTGAEPALGWPRGYFVDLLHLMAREESKRLAEDSPIYSDLRALAIGGPYEATPTQLLEHLKGLRGGSVLHVLKSPKALHRHLARLVPDARATGLVIELDLRLKDAKGNPKRGVRISLCPGASGASDTSSFSFSSLKEKKEKESRGEESVKNSISKPSDPSDPSGAAARKSPTSARRTSNRK